MSLTKVERRERKALRYHAFRMKTEAEGGAEAPEATEELVALSESPFFKKMGGWKKFGDNWDVTPTAPYTLVPLNETLWSNWDAEVKAAVKELPVRKKRHVNEVSAKELDKDNILELNIEI